MSTGVIFRAVKQHMLFILHRVGIVILSTKATVTLVPVHGDRLPKTFKLTVVLHRVQPLTCNCNKCLACSKCQRNGGFGGALAPAANTTVPADPCSNFDAFAALTVPQQMELLNATFCADADASSSMGFKFLGYAVNLVDIK